MLVQRPDTFTAPLAISRFSSGFTTDQGPMFAGMAIAMLPPLLLFLVLRRRFLGAIASGIGRR